MQAEKFSAVLPHYYFGFLAVEEEEPFLTVHILCLVAEQH